MVIHEAKAHSFMATYHRNENANRHTANIVHLAKHFGDESDQAKAKFYADEHKKHGHNIHHEAQYELHQKLWPKVLASHEVPMQYKESVESKEAEQLDELKKSTLRRYVPAAAAALSSHSFMVGHREAQDGVMGLSPTQKRLQKGARRNEGNRLIGIQRAMQRLKEQKESMELDELSEGVYVHASNYRNTHGKTPRGTGTWAFGVTKDPKPEHIFWHNGPYSEAKKKAVAHAKQRGYAEIHVLTEESVELEEAKTAINVKTYTPNEKRLRSFIPQWETADKAHLEAQKKARKAQTMKEDYTPISDVITLVANQQHAEATPILNDLLGSRVLDALQYHKQDIAKTLFAPGTRFDKLEESEQLDETTTWSGIGHHRDIDANKHSYTVKHKETGEIGRVHSATEKHIDVKWPSKPTPEHLYAGDDFGSKEAKHELHYRGRPVKLKQAY